MGILTFSLFLILFLIPGGIFLRDNNISGTIPTELATLEKLGKRCQDTVDCYTQGTVDDADPWILVLFLDVEHLQLTNNALEGTFPTEFGNVANLSKLESHTHFVAGCRAKLRLILSAYRSCYWYRSQLLERNATV